jgi:hypothetical protein
MNRPCATLTVTGHVLFVSQPGAQADFDWSNLAEGESPGLVTVNRAGDGFLIHTMISDGSVCISSQDPNVSAADWPEHTTFRLLIAAPLIVLQAFDEDELDAVYLPEKPGYHSVTVYARNRNHDRYDAVDYAESLEDMEQYLMVFTPDA